jgi:hypothetical protein
MAKVAIPKPDVKLLNVDGTVSQPWYDFLSSVAGLKLLDLSDVTKSSTPASGNTVRFSTTSNGWTFGA